MRYAERSGRRSGSSSGGVHGCGSHLLHCSRCFVYGFRLQTVLIRTLRATKTPGRASNPQGADYPCICLRYNDTGIATVANFMNSRTKFFVVVSSTCLVLLLLIGS